MRFLTQSLERPARYGQSARFDIQPHVGGDCKQVGTDLALLERSDLLYLLDDDIKGCECPGYFRFGKTLSLM